MTALSTVKVCNSLVQLQAKENTVSGWSLSQVEQWMTNTYRTEERF